MSEAAPPICDDDEEAMLAALATLDLSMARHAHDVALEHRDPAKLAEVGRTYHRFARSLRQTLALKHQIRNDDLPDLKPLEPLEPPVPRDEPRIQRRKSELREAMRRIVWSENEGPEKSDHELEDESDIQVGALEIENVLEDWTADNAFGLLPLDDHVRKAAAEMSYDPWVTRAWRLLPWAPFKPPEESRFRGDEIWTIPAEERQARRPTTPMFEGDTACRPEGPPPSIWTDPNWRADSS